MEDLSVKEAMLGVIEKLVYQGKTNCHHVPEED